MIYASPPSRVPSRFRLPWNETHLHYGNHQTRNRQMSFGLPWEAPAPQTPRGPGMDTTTPRARSAPAGAPPKAALPLLCPSPAPGGVWGAGAPQ